MSIAGTVCITGANRGIGFEFASQLLDRGWRVIAGYRDEESSNNLLTQATNYSNLFPFQVDVTDNATLNRLHEYIETEFRSIDMLINNSGIYPDRNSSLGSVEIDQFLDCFRVNVLGVQLTTTHLEPLLLSKPFAKIINIGSQMGSIALTGPDSPAYRVSKAAVNMLTRIQSQTYGTDKIVTVVFHPGWVRSDMGGSMAALSTDDSVTAMLSVIDRLTPGDNGKFLNYDGKELPF